MPNASTTASRLKNSTVFRRLARAGYAMSGVIHILIGFIAIGVAVGHGGEADQTGALGQLAGNPVGEVVLWLIAIGLIALGLFSLVTAVVADDEVKDRVKDAATGIVYGAIGVTAAKFALGGSSSSSQESQTLSAKLMSAPAGVVLLVVLGLAVVAVGVVFVVRGVRQKFLDDLNTPTGRMLRVTTATGTAGYVAKGVAIVIVGILFIVAAVTADPSKATGIDGALKSLAALPFGEVLLVIVAIGLIAYGAYCFLRARYARL